MADIAISVWRTREAGTDTTQISKTMLFSTPQNRQGCVGRSSLELQVQLARLLQIVNTSALVATTSSLCE